jgi:hypothetical protein
MKKMMTLISMIVFAITSYSQDHYVLACFLEEGEATIYKETKTGYVPIVSGNIFSVIFCLRKKRRMITRVLLGFIK